MSTRNKVFYTAGFFTLWSLIYFLTANICTIKEAIDTRIQEIDYGIPCLASTVWIYVSFYPFVVLSPLLLKDGSFRKCMKALLIMGFSLGLFYVVLPTTVGKRFIFSQETISEIFLAFIYENDVDLNALPSSHVAITTLLCWRILFDSECGLLMNAFIFLISLSIVLSTVFVRQHSVADLVAGVAAACIVGYFTNNISSKEPLSKSA